MRVLWFMLLAWLGSLQAMFGIEGSVEIGGFSPANAPPQAESLTNIAGCLRQVRYGSDEPLSIRVEGCVTLVDRDRNLVVVQDDSAAMAIYTALTALTLQPGQRIRIEGDGIFPCVRAFPNYPEEPSERGYLNSFEAPSGHGTYFLSRFRGFLHPPASGQYTFWISADDAGEFFLSPVADPKGMRKIAANKVGNATGPQEWDSYSSQRSQPVTLKAGEAYYVEALQVQGYGRDYLAVAWEGPGMQRSVIAGRYLTPWSAPAPAESQPLAGPLPTNGVYREGWTNFFSRSFDVLQFRSPNESMVRIHALKLVVAGEGPQPMPQTFDEDDGLDTIPNLSWVELEGEVSFAAASEGKLHLELKRGDSDLGVQVMNWKELPTGSLDNSHVRVDGVLEHAYGSKGEVTGNVMWVPDGRMISLLDTKDSQKQDLNGVSMCEIKPSNPKMDWGRQVSVRGRIINRLTNGLVVLAGDDNYQAFCSTNGSDWVSLGGAVEIEMGQSVLAGLALASHNNVDLTFGDFTGLRGLGTNWLGSNIGKHDKASQPGGFSLGDGALRLNGGGRQIGERADQHYYLYQPLADETDLCARVDLSQDADSRAQIGLMVRESLDPQAPCAAVLFTPARGPVFQYRVASGLLSSGGEANSRNRDYHWIKLVKRKSFLLVRGEPGAESSGDGELDVSGVITWTNETPILAKAFFRPVRKETPSAQPAEHESPKSIAEFVIQAQHPPEPFLYNRVAASELRGIVTFCGDYLGKNAMFVQEGNGGAIRVAWADARMKPTFSVGQEVEMHGYANVRKFPVVFDPVSVNVTGWGTLPEPEQYAAGLVKTEYGQARWVEATGVIRSEDTNGLFSMMTKDGALPVWVAHGSGLEARAYVDTLVRLRGVLSMDSAHAAELLVPSPGFVEVLEGAPDDPFSVPRFPIAQLGALNLKPERLRRMKLGGVVTCILPNGLYAQDETGGVYLEAGKPSGLHLGDRVEAVGYPDDVSGQVVLSGALVRKSGAGERPSPMAVSVGKVAKAKSAGMLVRLEAILLEQRDTPKGQRLTLQAGTTIFEAARAADGAGRLAAIPIGSRVAVTGVCQISQGGPNFEMPESETAQLNPSIILWLSGPADVEVLERPPWWTLKRVAGLGIFCATALLGSLLWVRMLRRRVARRTRELQEAMRQLEKETRTSAVLAERDRLAGEIHDSLEQGLTAIMLQLDSASMQADQSSETRRILQLARNMAEFSRSEVQHAVWDMQSPLLTNADLGAALKQLVGQINSGPAEVKIGVVGSPRPMPSSHEHHLLRIAQEAITNAFKHGQPRSINVTLDYAGSLVKLTIEDDGRGFSPGVLKPQWQCGQFGLQGIRARAAKIDARLDIDSQIGRGTIITVQMRLDGKHKDRDSQTQKPP